MSKLDKEIQRIIERNAIGSVSGRITEAGRKELRELYAQRDLLSAAKRLRAEKRTTLDDVTQDY